MYDIYVCNRGFDACNMKESQNYRQNNHDYYFKRKQCVKKMSKIMASS